MTYELLQTIQPELKDNFNVKETLTLLRRYGWGFLSWGARGFLNVQDKGLLFRVNGRFHKGYVLITLDWTDLYCVTLISTQSNIKDKMEMVFFDELFRTIDEKIETKV